MRGRINWLQLEGSNRLESRVRLLTIILALTVLAEVFIGWAQMVDSLRRYLLAASVAWPLFLVVMAVYLLRNRRTVSVARVSGQGSVMQPLEVRNQLDWLYRTLLVPTTFMALVHYTVVDRIFQLNRENPELFRNLEPLQTDVLIAPRSAIFLGYLIALSVVSYTWVYLSRGRGEILGRCVALFFLLFALIFAASSFIVAEFPFVLLPLPSGEVSLVLMGIVALVLSARLYFRASARRRGPFSD